MQFPGRNYRRPTSRLRWAFWLTKIETYIKRRNGLAALYEELIGDIPWLETQLYRCHTRMASVYCAT